MPKGNVTNTYESWKQRKVREQQKRAEERTRLLPPDLAQQILDAAAKERERLLERIEVLDESEARLDQMIEEVNGERLAATQVTDPERTIKKYNVRGEVVEVTRGSDARRITTPESRAIRRKLRALKMRKRTHKAERRDQLRKLADVGKVEAAARRGVVSAVLAITQDWTSKIDLGGLAPKVPLGRSYCDLTGVPLPEEALGPDGKPEDLPTARQAKAEAGGPLIVPEG